jgi:hypothetical protein
MIKSILPRMVERGKPPEVLDKKPVSWKEISRYWMMKR